jgi:hypothetical protein
MTLVEILSIHSILELLTHELPKSYMKWLRYQRGISLETQLGIISQRNKWANIDPRAYWRWDQVPRRSNNQFIIPRSLLTD